MQAQIKRRSLLHHRLQQAGAQFAQVDGAEIAMDFGGADEVAAARHLAIADLSALPRAGYKGAGAPAWLRQHGLRLPPQPNRACTQEDGTCVAALSQEEHLLLPPLGEGGGEGGTIAKLAAAWTLDTAPQCVQLPRTDSHCWLAVCGKHAGDTLPKLCGVDLRPPHFPPGAVAQTSLARVNTIVLRTALGETPMLYLLADSASTEYLWNCLQDAITEFNGTAIGLTALRGIAD